MNNTSPFDANQASLRYLLQPAVILRSLFASAIIWLLMASAMPSYSRLIFHGPLGAYFAAGLSMVLVSQIVIILITSLFSSDHATLVVPRSPTVVIQGMVASSVVAAAPANMPPEALFAAVYLVIVLSAVVAGGFLLLLGYLRAGGLIRYLPYPIVGGFMAGLGWLIVSAGLRILLDLRLNAQTLPTLFEGAVLARWLPALAFALCIFALRTRVKSTLIIPGCIIVFFVLFHAWVILGPGDVASLAADGWLLPEAWGALRWQLPDFAAVAQLDVPMVAASAGGILTLTVVYSLNLFFNASAQELIVNRELDFNREFRVNGLANMAASLCGGGIVAYHAPISSTLVETMRVNGRLVGIILALMFVLTLFFGSAIFSLIPRFIPVGLIIFFGLQFMKEWLLDSWSSLPRQDYIVVVVIALVTALFGLMAGIAVGIMVAITFFVWEYSRMEVIKQEFSGGFHSSNLDRPFAQYQFLQEEGDKILVMRLQGYIFFGTAYRFYERVKDRVSEDVGKPLRFLILDFKAVRGFDFSTTHDFKKLKRLTDKQGIELLISNASPHLQPALEDSGIVERRSERPSLFEDLDHALEWCENALLAEANALDSARVTVEQQIAQHTMTEGRDVSALYSYLERIEINVGDAVFEQGDESDALYFIESGRVDVLLRLPDAGELRLRSMTAGTVIGEVGFYLNKARTASVVATEAGVLQRLSHEALRRMGETDPRAASAIHILIASVLSDRLSSSNRVIQELLD